MYILGIETSCDETSVAILDMDGHILSNIVISQIKEHAVYGGVIPEIASRNHLFYISKALAQAVEESSISLDKINYIAVTAGPGLIGGVLVGVLFAQGLSYALNIPCYAINHLEGHALVPRLENNIDFPFLLLLASGGHCQFLKVEDVGSYQLLGATIDDAIGEAFDKVAKMLNLSYPGGPKIEEYAKQGNPKSFNLPLPLIHEKNANFSFSGLKTAVKNIIDKQNEITESFRHDMAASFQHTVCQVIKKKTSFILDAHKFQRMVVAGGVAANLAIKSELEQLCEQYDVSLYTPSLKLCTDNAAMIAWAAIEHIKKDHKPITPIAPKARWPLY